MKYWDGENIMTIVIKNKISDTEKNIVSDGGRTHERLIGSPIP